MNKRSRFTNPLMTMTVVILLLFAAGCSRDSSTWEAKPASKPGQKIENILIITVDTWRYDRVGLHANLVKTPHIDGFAKESMHFKNAFTHNPVTLPAHTNIMTGTTPLYHGISDNSGFRLEDRFLTMAEFFKEQSMQTAAFIGAFPLDSSFGLDQGFDLYDEQYKTHSEHAGFFSERKASDVVDAFIAWGEKQTRLGPWFTWVHLFDPHQPYLPPQPFADQYPHDLYSGEVAFTDQQLGRLWDWLKTQGLYENTLIVLVGDHGEGLGEHGERTHAYFAYNSTIHIPMFIRIPGVPGEMVSENVCHVDIFPTLCTALGLEAPGHLHGRSLLWDRSGLKDRSIYFESLTPYYNRNWAPLRGYVSQADKYIDLPLQELYDLHKDPLEKENRVRGLNWKTHRQILETFIAGLINPEKPERLEGVETDPKVVLRLQSLGYLPSDKSVKKSVFLPKDDLKTLLPVQNLMLDGMAHDQLNRPLEAIRVFEDVIRQRPDFVLTYALIASAHKKLHRYEQAIDIQRRGLQANPDNIYLLSKLGILLAEYGQPDEAITMLQKAIAQEPANPETYTYLGVAYHRIKAYDQALAQFEKALTLDRSNALLHNNIGAVYLEKFLKGRDPAHFSQAMAAFDKALSIDDKLHSALNGRGAAFSFNNQPERAMEDWQRAIAAKSDFPDAYFNLGVLLAKQGQADRAREVLTACRRNCHRTLRPSESQRLDRLLATLPR